MSWVTVVWSMAAAACLTLSTVHVFVAIRQKSLPNAFFAATGFSVAAVAAFEFALMRIDSPEMYGDVLRWCHVAIFLLVTSFVLFVRSFLNAGRMELAAAAIATRGAALLVNFLHPPNLNFTDISGLRHVHFLGEDVSVPIGRVSSWTRLGELSSVLLLVFLLDAAVTVWRRGERRRAAILGGCLALFVLGAAGHAALIHAGLVAVPYMISITYLAVVAAMGYELMHDLVRASELARELRVKSRALRESRRRLALAAEAADLGFWSWDLGRNEVWMSPRARALRGYGDERLDIERLFAAVHPEDRDGLRRSLQEAASDGGQVEREYRLIRPDGEMRWISLYASAARDPEDGRVQVQGVSIDVTPRKLADIEARRRQAEIAHLSRVTMLGELSGAVAHELNQPLTAILSNAQAALRLLDQEDRPLGEIREILSDIVEEDRRAGEVIRRLRVLLRKGEVQLEQVEVSSVVDDVLKLLRTDLLSHGVTVTTVLADRLPRVLGDEVQIEQVLVNLVANACDAMAAKDAGTRCVRLSAELDGSAAVRVSVADTGSGLPAGDLERVFEPFVTTKPQGMGLGLAVCRTIVGAHGGRLWAVNNEAGGATFHFTLPVFEAR